MRPAAAVVLVALATLVPANYPAYGPHPHFHEYTLSSSPAEGEAVQGMPDTMSYTNASPAFRSNDPNRVFPEDVLGAEELRVEVKLTDPFGAPVVVGVEEERRQEGDDFIVGFLVHPDDQRAAAAWPPGRYTLEVGWLDGYWRWDSFDFIVVNDAYDGPAPPPPDWGIDRADPIVPEDADAGNVEAPDVSTEPTVGDLEYGFWRMVEKTISLTFGGGMTIYVREWTWEAGAATPEERAETYAKSMLRVQEAHNVRGRGPYDFSALDPNGVTFPLREVDGSPAPVVEDITVRTETDTVLTLRSPLGLTIALHPQSAITVVRLPRHAADPMVLVLERGSAHMKYGAATMTVRPEPTGTAAAPATVPTASVMHPPIFLSTLAATGSLDPRGGLSTWLQQTQAQQQAQATNLRMKQYYYAAMMQNQARYGSVVATGYLPAPVASAIVTGTELLAERASDGSLVLRTYEGAVAIRNDRLAFSGSPGGVIVSTGERTSVTPAAEAEAPVPMTEADYALRDIASSPESDSHSLLDRRAPVLAALVVLTGLILVAGGLAVLVLRSRRPVG